MSKRTQLWIALGLLGVVIVLLAILFLSILRSSDDEAQSLDAVAQPATWQSATRAPADPWADLEDRALEMVWGRVARPTSDSSQRSTIRQVVETDLLRGTFPNLRWDRIERVGWRAFQQEGSVYEAQFILQDGSVEFGPAWIVQTDPNGLQPPGSGGVVPANLFAEVVERGVSPELERYLGREAEVVEALTNHRFERGARLASAILVYFRSRRHVAGEQMLGWTVVGERIVPNELTLYRAFFQWEEGGRQYFAHWQVNLDTRQFRGINLLASEIMALGDTIDASELQSVRPRMLDETTPTASQRRAFEALRTIVDNDRLTEAVTSLLWHKTRHGVDVEYTTSWNATPVEASNGVFEVSYRYRENEEAQQITWQVDVGSGRVIPVDELSRLVHAALTYFAQPVPGAEDG